MTLPSGSRIYYNTRDKINVRINHYNSSNILCYQLSEWTTFINFLGVPDSCHCASLFLPLSYSSYRYFFFSET